MNRLAAAVAAAVRAKVATDVTNATREVRLIFHGPPLWILSQVYDLLVSAGNEVGVPILLQVPRLDAGEMNPGVGASGHCDETHLLNLRNSPSGPTYVALIPPGQHSNRSVASTTDEFGMAAANNSGNVPFEQWWGDAFLQDLVLSAIAASGLPDNQPEDARMLVERAAAAADEVDVERTQRGGAWSVVSRLFSAASELPGLSAATRISLACGFPPMADGSISAREQAQLLEKIVDALAEGFGTAIDRISDEACDADASNLGEFLAHLRRACESPPGFERAPSAYYGPSRSERVEPPPLWWRTLTVEKWTELLAEESAAEGDLMMTCANPVLPPRKGSPVLVQGPVRLQFETMGRHASNAVVSIERTPAGPTGKEIGQIKADSRDPFEDLAPPQHRSPIRYVASSPGFKPGSIKVVSLATWQCGIFVTCRYATKLAPPKRVKARGKTTPTLETTLQLPGAGRYELLVFTSPGVDLDPKAWSIADEEAQRGEKPGQLAIRLVREGQFQAEVEIDGNHQVELAFTRTAKDGTAAAEACRVYLTVEEVVQQGCRSEFERLIRANRRQVQAEPRAIVQMDRSARSSSLQDWMLSKELCARSFFPVVMADDFVDAWVQPTWSDPTGPIFSNGRFIKDPRPMRSEFNPPEGFVAAREAIASRIRGAADQMGLVESAELGKWARDEPEFRSAIEAYLEAYHAWLAAEPDVASWVDVIAVTSLEHDRRTLSRVPDAIMLSPLHPVRLAWQSVAQQVLLEADELEKPCPAASVLDPDCVPDVLTLALRGPTGLEHVDFLSVENGTDYWSVLWNGRRLKELPERSRKAPFGDTFGISVGGISVGFSAAQVGRALEDVTELLAAKPRVGVAVASAGGATDACNEGLIGWCTRAYQQDSTRPQRQVTGRRFIDIYDDRDASARPDDATIANLTEDTGNSVRWFLGKLPGATPDLGIIAQLDMSEPSSAVVTNRTPVGHGALIRHRVRRQLPDAFLSESRQSMPAPAWGDSLADKLGACVTALENLGEHRIGVSFAPNVYSIRDMLERRRADFVAVSSSAIDPACFLGDWLNGAYLWDYDLPSYSHRAGDTNGYYLLSSIKEADRESLARALARLPRCAELPIERVQDVLLEVARRGIPTIRGLAGDDAGATGDLGLLLAVRLLQDRFRPSGSVESLMPVLSGIESDARIAIVVPVDPFRGYLSDLHRGLKNERRDASQARPDLLVVTARIEGEGVAVHLTPVEVKCRPGSAFRDVADALSQAKSLSDLLASMLPSPEQPRAWTLAFQHLLLSMIGFGMRVYSQHRDVVDQERWAKFHEKIASSILSGDCALTVDGRGRLIIVDDSPRSKSRDNDGDGFEETITIGLEDAGEMVAGDPTDFYESVRARLADWGFFPLVATGGRGKTSDRPVPGGLVAGDEHANTAAASEPAEAAAQGAPPEEHLEPGSNDADGGEAHTGVVLDVGDTVDGFQPRHITLNISDTRLNHMNMGVVGDLGTGKTQLLKSLITQVSQSGAANRGIRPRFLIFDYKRDYSSSEFILAAGARVVRPHRLPINLFDTSSMEETTAPWLHRYRFFADVLDKIYSGIGPVQRDRLKRSVKAAYDGVLSGSPPTLSDVHQAYADLADGKADAPLSIIGDLIDMEVFAESPRDTMPFDQFLDGVVVISLDALGQDDHSKNMLVAVMLNLFYENMLRTPKRPYIGQNPQFRAIDSYLLVDEADNIMRYEFDVLRKLLLQGREFGTGIILASQYLRHFKVNATDYREPLLTWFVHKVPNVTAAELGALGLTGSVAELAERVKSLENHQCLYKSFDVPGEIVRGLPFFELMQRRRGG